MVWQKNIQVMIPHFDFYKSFSRLLLLFNGRVLSNWQIVIRHSRQVDHLDHFANSEDRFLERLLPFVTLWEKDMFLPSSVIYTICLKMK